MTDLHMHTHISFDADPGATANAMCARALQRGLTTVALTNHFETDMVSSASLPYPDHETEERELSQAREAFDGKLTILRGIELGQACFDLKMSNAVVQKRPYDVVLGSLHNIRNEFDLYDIIGDESYTDDDLRAVYREYMDGLMRIASEADIDVLAHSFYPTRIIPAFRRERVMGNDEQIRETYARLYEIIIRRGIALEVNTTCMRSFGFPEPDPGQMLLTLYRDLGGAYVTVGSDAHRPEDVGKNVSDALALIKRVGFDKLTLFSQRKKYLTDLPDPERQENGI